MKTPSTCRCLLCQLESNLTEQLGEQNRQEDYSRAAGSSLLLSAFPTIFALTAHLRTCRSASNGNHPADSILIELVHARQRDDIGSLFRDVLLLAFIPALHSTSRQVVSRYPWLSPDDTAQHLVASLLEVLGSPELLGRNSHLAFVISRMVKRSVFDWAERELRSPARVDGEEHGPEPAACSCDLQPFERVVLLRHFLFRCHRDGLLTGADLELLVHTKLEGNFRKHHGAAADSNARRQKIKRLLQKLRQAARIPPAAIAHREPAESPGTI